jgi:hypothetical protein
MEPLARLARTRVARLDFPSDTKFMARYYRHSLEDDDDDEEEILEAKKLKAMLKRKRESHLKIPKTIDSNQKRLTDTKFLQKPLNFKSSDVCIVEPPHSMELPIPSIDSPPVVPESIKPNEIVGSTSISTSESQNIDTSQMNPIIVKTISKPTGNLTSWMVKTAPPKTIPQAIVDVPKLEMPVSDSSYPTPLNERSSMEKSSPRGKFTPEKVEILLRWYKEHQDFPNPNSEEAIRLSMETNLNPIQIKHWFGRQRMDRGVRLPHQNNKKKKSKAPVEIQEETVREMEVEQEVVEQNHVVDPVIKESKESDPESDQHDVIEFKDDTEESLSDNGDVTCSILNCHRVGSKGIHLLKCAEAPLREPNSGLICTVHYTEDLKEFKSRHREGLCDEDFEEIVLKVVKPKPKKRVRVTVDSEEEEYSQGYIPMQELIQENKEPKFDLGCSRLQGFTNLDMREFKIKEDKRIKRRAKYLAKSFTPITLPPPIEEKTKRRLQEPLNGVRTRVDCIRLGKSGIHSWGMFCTKPILANECIIEYIGEIIRNSLLDIREKEYEKIGSDYFFKMDENWSLDATLRGGIARFINHTCDPNCFTKVLTVNGHSRVYIYAMRDIVVGEELSYDYKFDFEDDPSRRIVCRCGSRKCKGYLNWEK